MAKVFLLDVVGSKVEHGNTIVRVQADDFAEFCRGRCRVSRVQIADCQVVVKGRPGRIERDGPQEGPVGFGVPMLLIKRNPQQGVSLRIARALGQGCHDCSCGLRGLFLFERSLSVFHD